MTEWCEAIRKGASVQQGGKQSKFQSRWIHPLSKFLKCSIAALFQEQKAIGVGMVLRDTFGQVLGCNLRHFNGVCQPKEAEVIGVREALDWIRERQVNQAIVETDSKVVYEALLSTQKDNSQFGQLLQRCRMLMRETHTTIAHVNKKANGVADALAKLAKTWNFCMTGMRFLKL